MIVYKVTHRILGRDKADDFYFDDRDKALEYYHSHEYVDYPRSVRVSPQYGESLTRETQEYFAYLNYQNGGDIK